MATVVKSVRKSRGTRLAQAGDKVLNASTTKRGLKQPIWEIIAEIASEIPDEEWAKVPDDGSINYKHYLYGVPKKNA